MKRKLLLLLALMAIGLSGAWAHDFSAVAPSGQTLYYDIVDGNARVTCQNSSYPYYLTYYPTGALVIPSTVTSNGTTYSVTSIGTYAFSGCNGLTSVTIPNSVTSIGGEAFYNCSGLTSVTIPNSVTSIGYGAFEYCSSLTSVTIPNSVTTIGEGAFYNCSGLTSVTIPNSVTTIGAGAFYGCSGLTSVTIPNSVASIESSAFSGCSGLTSVTIPNSVTTIGSDAFAFCSGLTSVTIGNSVTTIGDYAFYGCSNVDTLYYNARNLTTTSEWGNSSSYYNSYGFRPMKLKHLVIGDSVQTLPNYVFYNQDSLTSVTIGNSVTDIGNYTFYGCSGLTSVTIPNSVTSIAHDAFYGCSGLTSVTIGNSVTSIGDFAFNQCCSLTSVTIGNSVTSIGTYAFHNCYRLTSVTIPNSVTTIGDNAFEDCSGLTEITSMARTAPLLGEYAFNGVNIQIPVNIPCGTLASYMSRWSYFSNFVEDAGASFEVSSNDSTMGHVTVLSQPTCSAPHAVVNAVANPGYRFVRWDNGVTDNPYVLDLISDTALVAIFESASTQGVDDVMMNNYSISTYEGMIVVKDAEGELLRIFDIKGRTIVNEKIVEGKQYSMPQNGVYLVQVGNNPTQKIVVIK